MRRLIIRKILNTVIANIENTVDMGLVNGKTCVAMFLYECAKTFDYDDCRIMADELIKSVYNEIRPNMQININSGIGGIGIGITYLLKEKLLDGDVNRVLKDVDEKMFKDKELSVLCDTMYGGRLFTAGLYYYTRFGADNSNNGNMYMEKLLIMTDFFIKQIKEAETNIVEFSFVNCMLEILIQLCLNFKCSEAKQRIANLLLTVKDCHDKFRQTTLDLYVYEKIIAQLSSEQWRPYILNKNIAKGNCFEITEKDEICYLWMSFIMRKQYTNNDIYWAKEFVKKYLYNYAYDIKSINSRLSIVGLCIMKSLL